MTGPGDHGATVDKGATVNAPLDAVGGASKA